MFRSLSQAKEFQIHFQLTNLSRGDQSISDFYSKACMLSDTLAATGNPTFDKEFVNYLLNGLGPSYETFVTSITTSSDPITSHELYHLLLIHENRMSHLSQYNSNHSNNPFEPSANLTSSTPRDKKR